VWLLRTWAEWRAALALVKPDTILAWHPPRLPPVLDLEESTPFGSAATVADPTDFLGEPQTHGHEVAAMWSEPANHVKVVVGSCER
jgi:hypothetical protein